MLLGLGLLIGFSTTAFIVLVVFVLNPTKYHGQMVIKQTEDGRRLFSLEIDEDPEGFENMKKIVFKVVNIDPAE